MGEGGGGWFYSGKDFEREARKTRPRKTLTKTKKVNELELTKEYIKKNKNKGLEFKKASDL